MGQLGQTNGVIINACLATQDPNFELQGDLLMRVARDKTTEALWSQLHK